MINTGALLAQVQNVVDINPDNNAVGSMFETVTLANLISWLITVVLIVAGLIFFFMLLIGGLSWILSGGDKAKTESARNRITAALIGLIIVFAAWAIITLISEVFGLQITNFTIPSVTGVTD